MKTITNCFNGQSAQVFDRVIQKPQRNGEENGVEK